MDGYEKSSTGERDKAGVKIHDNQKRTHTVTDALCKGLRKAMDENQHLREVLKTYQEKETS